MGECAEYERCAFRFSRSNPAEREARCVPARRKRLCLKAAGEVQTRLAAMSDEEVKTYIESLVTSYCAQSDSPKCANEDVITNYIYNLYVQRDDDWATSLCMKVSLAVRSAVAGAYEASTGNTKRSVLVEEEDDFELMEEAMDSEYSQESSGIDGAEIEVDASSASKMQSFSALVGATVLLVLAQFA